MGTNIDGNRLSDILRLALVDLKTCYLKGKTTQPGQSTDSTDLVDWFWGETYAAQLLNEVRKRCLHHTEQDMIIAARVPSSFCPSGSLTIPGETRSGYSFYLAQNDYSLAGLLCMAILSLLMSSSESLGRSMVRVSLSSLPVKRKGG